MMHGLDSPDNRVRSNCDLATECVEECAAACPTTLHVFGQEMTVDQVLDEVKQGMLHVDAVLDNHQVTDPELDKKWVVADNRRVPANFQQAYETFPTQTFIARTPFMPEMNDDGEHIRAVVASTQPYQKVVDRELLPYCPFGEDKCEFLGRIYELEDAQRPSPETVHRLRAIIDEAFGRSHQTAPLANPSPVRDPCVVTSWTNRS
jgi:pyruvate formate lyase activating enzyme